MAGDSQQPEIPARNRRASRLQQIHHPRIFGQISRLTTRRGAYLFPSRPQQRLHISRGMYDAENLHSVGERKIKNKHFFKTGHAKHPQRSELWSLPPRCPSHLRLSCKQLEGFVGGEKKSVANLGAGFDGKIIRLLVNVLIGLPANLVARFHRETGLRSRASSFLCLSSQ